MIQQLVFLMRDRKLHRVLLLAHAYIRRCKFYLDDSLNRTMPEQGKRGHGYYFQAQVIHVVLSMLREGFIMMSARDIEEQVRQVPTCA